MAEILKGQLLSRLTANGPLHEARLSHLIGAVAEILQDGDVDADDYPRIVVAVKAVVAELIAVIDVPYVPAALEGVAIDAWAIPLAQSYAADLVRGIYQVLHLPLPPADAA